MVLDLTLVQPFSVSSALYITHVYNIYYILHMYNVCNI